MDNRNAGIAKRLCIVWVVSYGIMAIASMVYTYSGALSGNMTLIEPLSIYQVVTVLLVMCYFGPLLCVIHYHAKKACMKKLLTISRALLGFLSFWLLCVISMLI